MTRIQRKIPKKKRAPQTRDKKKPCFRLLPSIADKRGKNPAHARTPKSKFGNEHTRRKDERTDRKRSLRYFKNLKVIGLNNKVLYPIGSPFLIILDRYYFGTTLILISPYIIASGFDGLFHGSVTFIFPQES